MNNSEALQEKWPSYSSEWQKNRLITYNKEHGDYRRTPISYVPGTYPSYYED